jgi:hypothetical protein
MTIESEVLVNDYSNRNRPNRMHDAKAMIKHTCFKSRAKFSKRDCLVFKVNLRRVI